MVKFLKSDRHWNSLFEIRMPWAFSQNSLLQQKNICPGTGWESPFFQYMVTFPFDVLDGIHKKSWVGSYRKMLIKLFSTPTLLQSAPPPKQANSTGTCRRPLKTKWWSFPFFLYAPHANSPTQKLGETFLDIIKQVLSGVPCLCYCAGCEDVQQRVFHLLQIDRQPRAQSLLIYKRMPVGYCVAKCRYQYVIFMPKQD